MEKVLGISAVIPSYALERKESSGHSFYINGQNLKPGQLDLVPKAEERSDDILVGIGSALELSKKEGKSIVSIEKDLKTLKAVFKGKLWDLNFKAEQLTERLGEADNLVYSLMLSGNADKEIRPSFSGIIINSGNAVAISMGGGKTYLVRSGQLKNLNVENEPAKRLMKAGIISGDEAVSLSQSIYGNKKTSRNAVISKPFQVLPGDILLFCGREGIETDIEYQFGNILSENKEEKARVELLKLVEEARLHFPIAALEVVDRSLVPEAPKEEKPQPQRLEKALKALGMIDDDSESEDDLEEVEVVEVVVEADETNFGQSMKAKLIIASIAVIFVALLVGTVVMFVNSPGSNIGDISAINSEPTQEPALATASPDGNNDTDGINLEPEEYVIKEGDTLKSISKQIYGNEDEYTTIMESNGITSPEDITPGQVIKIYSKDLLALLSEIDNEPNATAEPTQGATEPDETTKPTGETTGTEATPKPETTPKPSNSGDVEVEEYIVQAGDTFEKISIKFYESPIKYDRIMEYNGLTDPDRLSIGQKLMIPLDE